mmetsp:Transcript_12761/g.19667  ORF Transcript_12761/g.19667 Transcript_12761/m.19667 type:complete len:408 (+) Transcript_12761:67-1290(+)
MANHHSWPPKPVVYTLIGLAFWTLLDLQAVSKFSDNNDGRRSLAITNNINYLKLESTLPPWAHYNLRAVQHRPDPSSETALFWHIPKSGGTTAKQLYQCMGKTLTIRIGVDPRYGHDQSDKLVVFKPLGGKDWKTVNVDTVSEKGILRAEEMGLAASGKADIIFAMDVNFASSHLFDRLNKGRVLSIFRHPVDRLTSKFYYLQTATWERTYRPEWADMSVLEWAEKHNHDENFLVKKIVGKKLTEKATMADLIIAKEIVRRRFIVGLLDEMEESVHRFNVMLGVDESDDKTKECMTEVFGTTKDESDKSGEEVDSVESQGDGGDEEENTVEINTNSNKHPQIVEGMPEYKVLAESNSLDMILYEYIRLLFKEQRSIINRHAREARLQRLRKSGARTRNLQRKRQLGS